MGLLVGLAGSVRASKERDFTADEAEKARKAAREDYLMKLNDDRQMSMLEILGKRRAAEGAKTPEAKKALMWAKGKFGNVEGSEDILAQAQYDPSLAEELQKSWEAADAKRKSSGLPMVSPEDFIGTVTLYGGVTPGTGLDYEAVVQELSSGDFTNNQEYFDMLQRVQSSDSQGAAALDIPATDVPDFTRQEDQAKAFDTYIQAVATKARDYLLEQAGPEDKDVQNLTSALLEYGKPEAQALTEGLRVKYGPTAAKKFGGDLFWSGVYDNPYISQYLGAQE